MGILPLACEARGSIPIVCLCSPFKGDAPRIAASEVARLFAVLPAAGALERGTGDVFFVPRLRLHVVSVSLKYDIMRTIVLYGKGEAA